MPCQSSNPDYENEAEIEANGTFAQPGWVWQGDRVYGDFLAELASLDVYILNMSDYEDNVSIDERLCFYHHYGMSGSYSLMARNDSIWIIVFISSAPQNQTVWWNWDRVNQGYQTIFFHLADTTSVLLFLGSLGLLFAYGAYLTKCRTEEEKYEKTWD
jgi:hypothetical protein